MQNDDEPILYILIRTDMDSLQGGRIYPQVAHAASDFESLMRDEVPGQINIGDMTAIRSLFWAWKGHTQNQFGTTIVLDGISLETFHELDEMMENSSIDVEYVSEHVVDERYKLEDGGAVHEVSVITGMYVFGKRGELRQWMQSFALLG